MERFIFFLAYLFLAMPLLAAEGDTTKSDPWEDPWGKVKASSNPKSDTIDSSPWNDPWGDAKKKKLMHTLKLESDLIKKKNKEIIVGKILNEYDSNLKVLVSKKDVLTDTVSIAKNDIEYFVYNYDYESQDKRIRNIIDSQIFGEPTTIGTLGFLQAGGFVGFDVEQKLFDHVGAQIGLGLFGADAALNIHLEKSINSPYISIQARDQLVFTYGWGVAYGHRFDNGFAFQAGVMLHAEGRNIDGVYIKPKTVQMLIISIGKWFRL